MTTRRDLADMLEGEIGQPTTLADRIEHWHERFNWIWKLLKAERGDLLDTDHNSLALDALDLMTRLLAVNQESPEIRELLTMSLAGIVETHNAKMARAILGLTCPLAAVPT